MVELDDVPDECKTPELYRAAVQASGYQLKHVPEEMRTLELCVASLQGNHWLFDTYKHIPDEIKSSGDFWDRAVQKYHEIFKYVPEEFKTPALCLEAVQNSGKELQHVPEEQKSAKLCLVAVQSFGRSWSSPQLNRTQFPTWR